MPSVFNNLRLEGAGRQGSLQIAGDGAAYTCRSGRSDGKVTAVGKNGCGQCNVPELPLGKRYTQAAGGWSHSILLRNQSGNFTIGGGRWAYMYR